jgi:metal-responsive CopG/Arc/MetJ family transcriptional regulator
MEDKLHRTQISIEDWQFQTLTEISKKTKKSMSSIIREMLSEKFLNKRMDKKDIEKDAISELLGIGAGSGLPVAKEHDKYLYGKAK